LQRLDVDQVGGVQIGVLDEPREQTRLRRPADQHVEKGRGVEDDQRSRPARTASTIASLLVPALRLFALASTSAIGGRSATRTTSASRADGAHVLQ
jgi:hypothetical protein